jgi:transcriptional regulator with XRE-family HTH domain
MPSDSLAPGLESYEIGPKINTLRKSKGLSLVKLGEHTGMSAGLLSKIERGRLVPILPAFLSGLTKVEFKLHEQEWQKDSRRRPVVFGASPPL